MTYATSPKSSEQISEKKDSTLAADSTDQFVKSGASFTPAYTKATVTDNRSGTAKDSTSPDSKVTEQEAKKQAEKKSEEKEVVDNKPVMQKSVTQTKNELMRDMVMKTITGQADDSHKTGAMKELEEILRSYSDDDDEEEKDEDYWGAEATANRILDFAKELANGDNEKFDTLRKAFEQGFSESEKYFGGKGKLPSVSYETYDRVQKGFDDWAKQIAEKKAETDTETPAKLEVEK